MVLQICIDDSSTDGESLVLAGYIAPTKAWAAFSNEWAEMLTVAPRWSRFKMSEIMANGFGPEQAEKTEWLYRVIEKYAVSSICVAIPRQPLSRAVRDFDLPSGLSNPYFLAWRAMVAVCLDWQHRSGNAEPVDFIFDRQSEAGLLLEAWDGMQEHLPENSRRLIKDVPIFRKDEEFLPLQAADMLAWWMRKRFSGRKTIIGHDFPFPWAQKKPGGLEVLQAQLNERGIRKQLKSDREAVLNGQSEAWRLSTHWMLS